MDRSLLNAKPLTLDEVASQLDTSVEVIRGCVRRNELKAFKVGKRWKVDPLAIEQFKQKQANKAPEPKRERTKTHRDPDVAVGARALGLI